MAFNRKVYASRGMDLRSLQHRTSQDEPLGVQFYRQFRNALTPDPGAGELPDAADPPGVHEVR